MKYDFDEVVDRRGTDCYKWDASELLFGDKDIIPMWVADMDFKIAKPITEALRKRTEHEIYGYTMPSQSLIEAVVERMQKKYNWLIEPEWVVFTPGVVPALNAAVKAFTSPGDSVVVQEPVYYPFFSAIKDNGAHIASNDLKLINGHYEIDFEDLEKKFGPQPGTLPITSMPSRAKAMILCNPHNPVGRVWTKEELIKMGEIAISNDAVVISDEIHCELLFKGYKHIPFASISEEFKQHSIVCMAPSKTFNLAGLETSVIIIPNEKLRNKFNEAKGSFLQTPNTFGLVAMEAAFRYGDEWLEQLLEYIQENLEFLMDYFEKRIPKIKVIKPEGTYLVWLDCRELGMDAMALNNFMNRKAKVGLDDGYLFGTSGAGFERINIACPRSLLEEGLKRIENAVNSLY